MLTNVADTPPLWDGSFDFTNTSKLFNQCKSKTALFKMAYTFFDSSVQAAKAALTSLDGLLTQAEKHIPIDKLLTARLYEDMFPFPAQIRAASTFSRKILWRLNGADDPDNTIQLSTYAEMHELLQATIKELEEASKDKDEINKNGEIAEPTKLSGPIPELNLTGKAYVHGATLPNIQFHCAMAYAILRKEGVPVGKKDWMIGYIGEFLPPLQL